MDVGLVDPTEKRPIGNRKRSVASNHYDSDDANDAQSDGRNRHRGGSSAREQSNNAAKDLEASPKEAMGMFYSLEVLDGKDYEILDKGGNVRIFREKDKQQQKQPQEQSKQNKKKKRKKQQQQQQAAKIDDAENDEKAATPKQPQQSQQQQQQQQQQQPQSQPQQEPPNETPKKQKRKQKRKRNDKAKSTDTDMNMNTDGSASKETDPTKTTEKKNVETGHGNDDAVAQPAKDNQQEKGHDSEQEKEGQGKKKRQKKNKNNKNKGKQRSKGVDSHKASGAAVDDASISSVQQSWLIATGGVLLHQELCRSLAARQFWRPTPIQAATLPAATLGRRNLVGAAPTGSGKTLAYLLPILQDVLEQRTGGNAQEPNGGARTDDTGNDKVNKKKNDDTENEIVQPSLSSSFLRALILTPTRELAMQVSQASLQLCPSVAVATLVGGMALPKQARVLKTRKPPIVVATPGRLWEMVRTHQRFCFSTLCMYKCCIGFLCRYMLPSLCVRVSLSLCLYLSLFATSTFLFVIRMWVKDERHIDHSCSLM